MSPRQSVSIRPLTSVLFLFVILIATASPAQVIFGARQGSDGLSMPDVVNMEQWLGKKNAVILLYTNWCDDPVATPLLFNTQLPNLWNNGNVPLITWEPYTCGTTPANIDIQIANGSYDAFMQKWVNALKTFLAGPDGIFGTADDRRVFLRLAHEMNGNWYPWSAGASQSPSDYISMWQHVRTFFDNAGLDRSHVQWIWCANTTDSGNYTAEQYYPGDSYVDWLAQDGYNFGYSSVSPASAWWPTPQQRFDPMFTRLAAISPIKPVAVTEIGSTSSTATGTDVNAKNQWVQDAYNYLASKSSVRMIVYFNKDKARDWTVFGGSLGDSTYQSGSTTYNVYSGYKSVLSNSTFVSTDPGNPQLLSDSLFMASPGSSQSTPAPTVSAVSPNNGSTSGGTLVTITGTGFTSAATVKIGGLSASNVSVANTNSISAATPAGSAGTADVTVTNSDGQSGTLAAGFTYTVAGPLIASLSPPSGTTDGGTVVTISGSGFQSGAAVTFGGAAGTNVSVSNSTTVMATTPTHAAGSVDVVVTNPDNTTATATGAFSYTAPAAAAPAISAVSPNTGSTNGGTVVTITGTGFASGASVTFGGAGAAGVSVTSSTSLTATTPAHAAGTVDVTVTNSDGQSGTATGAFSYAAPTPPPAPPPSISGVSPNSGTTSGGTTVTISGSGFQQGASVAFGAVAATNVTVSSSSISATTPAHAAGAVDVVVTNPDSQTGTASGAYTYVTPPPTNPPPTIGTLTPTSGSTTGGTVVAISGTGFQVGASVTFGGAAATAVSVSSGTSMSATTPAHSAATVDVVVTNPDNQTGTASSSYTYVAPPPGTSPPSVSSLSVTSGTTTGGTVVKIIGTNFQTGATVKFGGTAATNTSVTSTSITATTPAHAAGVVDVVVTNPDGQSGTLAAANLLLNPGFEKGTASWAFSGTGKATALNVAGRAHTGSYYAELTSASGQHPIYNSLTSTGATAYFAVQPGQTVNFSAWGYRVSGNGSARITLVAYDAKKANPTYLASSPSNVSTASWILQKNIYAVPTGKAYVRAYLEIYGNTKTSVARFDDVSLVTGGFTYK